MGDGTLEEVAGRLILRKIQHGHGANLCVSYLITNKLISLVSVVHYTTEMYFTPTGANYRYGIANGNGSGNGFGSGAGAGGSLIPIYSGSFADDFSKISELLDREYITPAEVKIQRAHV